MKFSKHDQKGRVVMLKFTLELLRLMGKLVIEYVEYYSRCYGFHVPIVPKQFILCLISFIWKNFRTEHLSGISISAHGSFAEQMESIEPM